MARNKRTSIRHSTDTPIIFQGFDQTMDEVSQLTEQIKTFTPVPLVGSIGKRVEEAVRSLHRKKPCL